MGLALQIWIVFLHLSKTERDDVVIEQLTIIQPCDIFSINSSSVFSNRRVSQRSVPLGDTMFCSPSLNLWLNRNRSFTTVFALKSSAASHGRTLLDARRGRRQRKVLRWFFGWLVGEVQFHAASQPRGGCLIRGFGKRNPILCRYGPFSNCVSTLSLTHGFQFRIGRFSCWFEECLSTLTNMFELVPAGLLALYNDTDIATYTAKSLTVALLFMWLTASKN